jgi:hypothetical protein
VEGKKEVKTMHDELEVEVGSDGDEEGRVNHCVLAFYSTAVLLQSDLATRVSTTHLTWMMFSFHDTSSVTWMSRCVYETCANVCS